MDELFQVIPIEGKGLGCIAQKTIKKETLILQEKPQCVAKEVRHKEERIGIDIQSLIESFYRMSKADQKEYLKLFNRFEGCDDIKTQRLDWMLWIKAMFDNEKKRQELRDIVGIYNTNAFGMGVGIRSSRFNHSCTSNAEAIWDEVTESIEITAVSEINAGDEITVNYGFGIISMKSLKIRQEFLLSKWGFSCSCDLCEKEKTIQSFHCEKDLGIWLQCNSTGISFCSSIIQ